jgi:hypothetical protein
MSAERFSKDLLPLVKPIDFAIEDPYNAKLHPDESVDGIAASLEAYGQYKPVVYWVKNDRPVIKMGNGTFRAAKKLGWRTLAMSEFEGTECEAMGAALLDNKLPELAPWNPDVLASQVAALELDGKGIEWSAPEIQWEAPPETVTGPAEAPVIDVVATPVIRPTPAAAPVSSTRVKHGEIWIMTAKEGGDEHRLMCGDPKNPRVIRELCGTQWPAVRRIPVPPDERARWWLSPGRSHGDADSMNWPGWAGLSGALSGELHNAGWNIHDLIRISHRPQAEVLSWFSGVMIPEDAYRAIQEAGVARNAFQHPYLHLANYHALLRATEKADSEHVRSIVLGTMSPGEILLDTDGGSGSFIGCMNSDRVCFMVLASAEECDNVLEQVEQFTGRKSEKA